MRVVRVSRMTLFSFPCMKLSQPPIFLISDLCAAALSYGA